MSTIATNYGSSKNFTLGRRWYYIKDEEDAAGVSYNRVLDTSYSWTSHSITFTNIELPSGNYTITQVDLNWTGKYTRAYVNYAYANVNGNSIKEDGFQVCSITEASILNEVKSKRELTISFSYYPSTTLPATSDNSSYLNTVGKGAYDWKDFSITVHYKFNYTILSTPSVAANSSVTIKDNDSATFTWGASSPTGTGSTNEVNYYQIYKNGAALTTTTSTSYSITGSSVGSDSSAVFTVQAISTKDTAYNSAISNGFTVQRYKDFTMPTLYLYTNKNSTQASTITIGTSEPPSITAVWDINDLGGNYDSIKSITFNNITLSTDAESYPIGTISSNTTYTLAITMKSGYSGTSTATVNIATVGTINFSPTPAGTVGPSTTYSWSSASGATNYYFVLNGNIGDYSGTTTSTSINQNISSYVNNGSSFTFKVYPQAEASYGGYTRGTGITATQTRAPKPTIIGDINSDNGNVFITGDTSIQNTYAYNTVAIKINSASSYSRVTINANTQTSAIKDFTNNSAATLSTSHTISSISEGTSITYTIKLYNSYGEENEYTYTIVRFQRPTVNITGVATSSGVSNKTATINFRITPSPHSASGSTYYCPQISYGGQTFTGTETKYNNETYIQVSIDFQNSSTLTTQLSTLYNALRGINGDLPIGRPTLSFNIIVYDKNIGSNFSNKASSDYNQVIDYRAIPLNSKLTVSSSAAYPSSKDTITLTSSASIIDAAGNTGGLIYSITRANPYAIFTGASIQEVLNTISNDTTYTYTLTVSKQYKDGNVSANPVSASINVYRFIPPSFTVSNLQWEQNKLMGTINISDLGGSDNKVPNISNYICTVREIGGNNLYTKVAINGDYSNNQVTQNFSYSRTEGAKEISLQIIVTVNSKSGQSQQVVLGPFLVKPSGIPFSIRKNGAGVHVEANFNPETSDAAFKVIGNSDTDAIVEFSNGNNRKNSNILLNSNGIKGYLSLQCPEGGEPYFTIIFE